MFCSYDGGASVGARCACYAASALLRAGFAWGDEAAQLAQNLGILSPVDCA
jgi:hypothetical protein